MARVVRVHVDGDEQEINLDELLTIINPERERETVAADIAYWGAKYGESIAQQRMAEAAYQKWSGQQLSSTIRADDKIAEWKANAFKHGSPEYSTMKDAEANAESNAIALGAVFEAHKQKGRILERLIGVEQALIGAAGRIGREETAAPERPPAAEDPRVKKAAGVVKHPSKK